MALYYTTVQLEKNVTYIQIENREQRIDRQTENPITESTLIPDGSLE